jgi:NADPH-dependent 2,4-dienoyl-CoA reductase/sulfur reductase-like enzyme/rhodanese-related sulfurtransferase
LKIKLLIVGGVAAGATAAARARRIDEEAEITVIERGPYVSYANCGLPYFVSGDIEDRSELLLQTPEGFDTRYRVRVELQTEAVEIDRAGKRVKVLGPEGEKWLSYDKLILAQGGNPVVPPIPGADAVHAFKIWTVPDMDRIHDFIDRERPQSAVIAGGGFIGLEMAEAFRKRGLDTTVVELLPNIMSVMDWEFGATITDELEANGVHVITGVGVKSVLAGERMVELSDGRRIPAQLVRFSVGVRPELTLARNAGLEIGPTGGLKVNERMQTTDPDIFAAGDSVEVVQKVSGEMVRVPLAGPANRQGRIAASNALGVEMTYRGALGSSVVKIFEATAAMTGLSEKAAREAGFDVGTAVIYKGHHAGYYPGAEEIALKLVYERQTGQLIGAQAFGRAGVEKRIDVLAMALQGKLTLHELAEVDLAYAPPYGTANDPINIAAFVAINDLTGFSPLITASDLKKALAAAEKPVVLDVRTQEEYDDSHLRGALHIPVDELRDRLAEIPQDRTVLVHCRLGFRAHLALRILKQRGFHDVRNVTGGFLAIQAEGGFVLEQPS